MSLLISIHLLAAIVDIFTSGQDGYLLYRIPSLLRLPDGRITCFCEGRKTVSDVGYNDLVYRTSLDSTGETWGPMRLLRTESTNTTHVALNNPTPMLDGNGSVVLLYARNVRQVFALRSLDAFGQQWPSEAVDITYALRLADLPSMVVPGPPAGLQVLSRCTRGSSSLSA